MAKKAIIIGSGFGGLAAALRLRAKGLDVTLVEKQPDLGGRARVFKKGSFIYDGGPTVITAPYLFEELFSLFNKKISNYVDIVPLDLWYRFVFSDGQTFDYSGDEKSMEKEVKKFSDKDFEGYNNLVAFTEKIFNKGFFHSGPHFLTNYHIEYIRKLKKFLNNDFSLFNLFFQAIG